MDTSLSAPSSSLCLFQPILERADDNPDLPTEVWEQIFDYLSAAQLLLSREVCQRWRSIVDGSSQLLDKLKLIFQTEITLDDDFEPKNLFPAKKVVFDDVDIVSFRSWWPDTFGTRLTDLSIDGGSVLLPTLLTMVRQTPRLKRFELRTRIARLDDASSTEFRLEKMNELILETDENDMMLDLFKSICPRLKRLKVAWRYSEQHVVSFVEALQDTLESIELSIEGSNAHALIKIAHIERLRLKQVSLYFEDECACDHLLSEFSRVQPWIESLKLNPQSSQKPFCLRTLVEICRSLTKLKHLDLFIWQDEDEKLVPTFLEASAKLESLKICSTYIMIDFSGLKNPILKELHLERLHPVGNSLQRYMEHSPNLRSLTLRGVHCMYMYANSFTLLQENRTNWGVSNAAEPGRIFQRLEVLNIDSDISPDLLNLCPCVKKMHLDDGSYEDLETIVLLVCQKLKFLRQLTLGHVTESMVECIACSCRALVQLKAYSWLAKSSSGEAKKRLRDKGIEMLFEKKGRFVSFE